MAAHKQHWFRLQTVLKHDPEVIPLEKSQPSEEQARKENLNWLGKVVFWIFVAAAAFEFCQMMYNLIHG